MVWDLPPAVAYDNLQNLGIWMTRLLSTKVANSRTLNVKSESRPVKNIDCVRTYQSWVRRWHHLRCQSVHRAQHYWSIMYRSTIRRHKMLWFDLQWHCNVLHLEDRMWYMGDHWQSRSSYCVSYRYSVYKSNRRVQPDQNWVYMTNGVLNLLSSC